MVCHTEINPLKIGLPGPILAAKIGIIGFTTKQDRGRELREILKKQTISLDQLVIKTDCPFMMPAIPKEGFQKVKFTEVKKGHNNEPCTLILVANCIAQCYGVSVQEVVDITTRNVLKISLLTMIRSYMRHF